jgi:DhnA family fructose-bisphosphate aldolase class Ia
MAKKIINTITKLDGENTTYGEIIMLAVKAPDIRDNGTAVGIDYDKMKQIKRIDDIIGTDKLKQDFVFEDSDFKFVVEKLKKTGWTGYDPALITVIEDIEKSESVKIE